MLLYAASILVFPEAQADVTKLPTLPKLKAVMEKAHKEQSGVDLKLWDKRIKDSIKEITFVYNKLKNIIKKIKDLEEKI